MSLIPRPIIYWQNAIVPLSGGVLLENEEKKRGKSFWDATRMLFVLFIVLGIIVGALVMHFVVEPYLSNPLRDELTIKTNELKEMSDKYFQCIKEKEALEREA